MAATASPVDGAPAPSPAPAPAAPRPPEPVRCNYKNLLQEFLQRAHKNLPVYTTECRGQPHQLNFRCTVKVDCEEFPSYECHRRVKDAEQDAARVAYDILVRRREESADVDVTDMLELIDQDVVFSKSILHEFSVKTAADKPSYSAFNSEGSGGPMKLFVATVLFAGNTYTGGPAINKKDAEQKAARVVIKTILATKNTCMAEIVRSKKNLIAAITSPGHNKERGAVSQKIHDAPTSTPLPFTPIKFTNPVTYETYDGPSDMVPVKQPISSPPFTVQEPNTMPESDPSSNSSVQTMHVSKKQKKNSITGPEAKEERVRK